MHEQLINSFNFLGKEPFYREVTDHNKITRSVHRDSTIFPRVYMMYFETSIKIWNDNFYLGSGPRTYKFKSSEPKYFTQSDHSGFILYRDKINREVKDIQERYKLDFKNEIDELAWKKGHGFIDDSHYDGFLNISGANSHPHHIYFQLLSETGIIGFSMILALFIFCSLKIFTKIQIYYKCIIMGILINLFPFTLSGNFFNNWLSILFFFPIGFLCIKNTNKI